MIRIAIALCALLANGFAFADELVQLPTRDGVTQPYFLHHAGAASPAYALLLFPGGDGVVGYRERGKGRVVPARKGNFLVRSVDLFAADGFVAAVMDVPSDHTGGMSDEFRSGAEHAQDVTAVVADLRKRFAGVKVILVGTSRGTVSAAYAGRALGAKVDGVVLTSSTFRATRNSIGLNSFPFRDIAAPLLFVHHEHDDCTTCCSYGETRWRGDFPLVTVKGGNAGSGNPCEAQSHHGYLGQEPQVVAAIRSWIAGRPYPQVIE